MRLSQEDKENVLKYIRFQHRQTDSWLHEHIKKKFGFDIPKGTIRYYKCKIDGGNTNRASCRRDWLNFIRKNYKSYTDKEMAKLLKDKFQRDISWMHVKKLRIKHHLLKPRTQGKYTVKEIRKCLVCGKDIKITCRNPKQKYCSMDCVHKAQRTDKRNLAVCSEDMINSFIKKYSNFAKAVIYQNRETLSNMDCEDLYSDYLFIVPSLVYGARKYTEEKHIRGYIAKAIKNLILKKHNERNNWHAHNVELESLSFKFL